jgi:hypothetical protein
LGCVVVSGESELLFPSKLELVNVTPPTVTWVHCGSSELFPSIAIATAPPPTMSPGPEVFWAVCQVMGAAWAMPAVQRAAIAAKVVPMVRRVIITNPPRKERNVARPAKGREAGHLNMRWLNRL